MHSDHYWIRKQIWFLEVTGMLHHQHRWTGIYAAVTRRTLDNENDNGWIPEQKITVEEALRAYTINAAYASFEENIKGSLESGKLADFVVLEKDITTIPAPEIRRRFRVNDSRGRKERCSGNENIFLFFLTTFIDISS